MISQRCYRFMLFSLACGSTVPLCYAQEEVVVEEVIEVIEEGTDATAEESAAATPAAVPQAPQAAPVAAAATPVATAIAAPLPSTQPVAPPPVAPAAPAPPPEQFGWPDTAVVNPDAKPLVQQEALLPLFKAAEDALKKADDQINALQTTRDLLTKAQQEQEQLTGQLTTSAAQTQGTLAARASEKKQTDPALDNLVNTLTTQLQTVDAHKKGLQALLSSFDQATIEAKTKLQDEKTKSSSILQQTDMTQATSTQTSIQASCDQIIKSAQELAIQSTTKVASLSQELKAAVTTAQATVTQITSIITKLAAQEALAPVTTVTPSPTPTPAPTPEQVTTPPTSPQVPTSSPAPSTPAVPAAAATPSTAATTPQAALSTPTNQPPSTPQAATTPSTPPVLSPATTTPAEAPTTLAQRFMATGMALLSCLWNTLNPQHTAATKQETRA